MLSQPQNRKKGRGQASKAARIGHLMVAEEKAVAKLHTKEQKILRARKPAAPKKPRFKYVPKNQRPTVPTQIRMIPTLNYDANAGSNGGSLTFGDRGFVGRGLLVNTHNELTDAVLNGVSNQDPRWPDNFSMLKTITIVQTSSRVINSINSSSVAGGYTHCAAGVFMGTNKVPGVTIKNAPAGVPDWSIFDVMPSLYSTSDFMARPCGQVFDLQFNLQGLDHTIEVNAFPIIPINSALLTATPAGWPTDLNTGPTDLHCSWGARSWHVKSGDRPIRLCCAPMDSRGLDFWDSSIERQSYLEDSGQAWSGWVFWVNGLFAADVVRVTCTSTWELAPVPVGTTSMYMYPTNSRPADSTLMDKTSRMLCSILDGGFNAFQWTTTTGTAVLAAYLKLRGQMSAEQRFGPPNPMSAPLRRRPARLKMPLHAMVASASEESKSDESLQPSRAVAMSSSARSLNAEREDETLTGPTTRQEQSRCSSSTACPPSFCPSTQSASPQPLRM